MSAAPNPTRESDATVSSDEAPLRAVEGREERPGARGARRARDRALRGQARDRRPGGDARAAARGAPRRRARAARGRARAWPRRSPSRPSPTCSAARSSACSSPPTSCRPTWSARGSTAPDTGGFDTELGPVFCNFLLADEINRAPAKVQSALLEVMQERQVTIGHETHPVPAPFLVLATQNPIESEGTYPLPEAQVDRFMFKLMVDYPARPRRGRGGRALARGRRHGAGDPLPGRARPPPGGGARRLRRPARDGVRRRAHRRDARGATRRAGSSSAPRRAARSTWSTPAARSRCCAAATTCCPPTCATSRATCSATASCSPTRPSRPASTPTASSTACSSACPCPRSSWRTEDDELPRAAAARGARRRPDRRWSSTGWRSGGGSATRCATPPSTCSPRSRARRAGATCPRCCACSRSRRWPSRSRGRSAPSPSSSARAR